MVFFRGIDEKKPSYDEEYGEEPDEAFVFAEMDSDDLIEQVQTQRMCNMF